MFAILVLAVVSLIVYLYYVLNKIYSYWSSRGIVGPKPHFIVGNLLDNVLKKKSAGLVAVDIYNKYKGYPVVGIYQGLNPQLLIRDPDLVKNITVKDFKHFANNDFDVDKELDPIFGRNPFVLKDEEWKKSRSQLTPFFTSAKLKNLAPLIDVNTNRLINHIKNNSNAVNSKGIEAKYLCTQFTLDNVASCIFGIDAKSFEQGQTEFKEIAKDFITQDLITSLKFLVLFILPLPTVIKFLQIRFLSKETNDKIQQIVSETIEYRQKNNVVRNDFLNMLQELRKQNPDALTYTDLSGHAGSFIFDGFETSSNVMSYVLFNLAANQEAQQKLREEIETFKKQGNGVISFDKIKDMKYLDACLNESLRVTPPILTLGKQCTQDYEYTPTNTEDFKEITIKIEKGTSINLPIAAYSWDAKYFPEPDKFKPEHFLDEESKPEQLKSIFFPFGVGPRACLGQAFGILQVKLGIIGVIQNYHMKVNPKMKLPLRFDPWHFLHSAVGGLWLNFEEIKQ